MLNRRMMLLAPLGLLAAGKSAAAKPVTITVEQGIASEAFINSRAFRLAPGSLLRRQRVAGDLYRWSIEEHGEAKLERMLTDVD